MGKLTNQIPETLDMMVRSLRAGHPIPVSIAMIATEMPAPIGVEFKRVADSIAAVDEANSNGENDRTAYPNGDLHKRGPAAIERRMKMIEDPEEEETDAASGTAVVGTGAATRKHAALRLQSARILSVAIRSNAQVFEDAKLAADGFKNGEQQIVNLEHATPQMAERIIDFLNGVCYALDGTVERVGDKVYLFAPANVAVEVDEGATATTATTPTRRAGFGDKREN